MQKDDAQIQAPNVPTVEPAGSGSAQKVQNNHGGGVHSGGAKADGGGKSVLSEVVKKIKEAENVLVALSSDPSVDEMAAAIGLSLLIESIEKHATAIYSGQTPNVLQFLKPEETFETTTNGLQDFIIALDKEKADHLRYKVDGEFVKVYITPYRTTINESDLEFSRGDFNVDLVISLNVPAATELDAALREYGRIMHDATAVNITNRVPGKFGDVEWVEPSASSISEMVAELALELRKDLDTSIATALLTGIAAATDKFGGPTTTPEVMMLAAKLMKFGANQQEIFKNISQELEFVEREAAEAEVNQASGELISGMEGVEEIGKEAISDGARDNSKFVISHGAENVGEQGSLATESLTAEGGDGEGVTSEGAAKEATVAEGVIVEPDVKQEDTPVNPHAPEVTGEVSAVIPEDGGQEEKAEEEPGEQVGDVENEVTPEKTESENLADEILNRLKGEGGGDEKTPDVMEVEQGTPRADYGQMIDGVMAEPMPGEVPAGAPTMNPGAGMDDMAAMMGATPMGTMRAAVGTQTGSAQDEAEAMNMIKQANTNPNFPEGMELPSVIPGGGSSVNPNVNPAMNMAPVIPEGMATPAQDVPQMNYQPMPAGQVSSAVVTPDVGIPTGAAPGMETSSSVLPMPEQGLGVPPTPPMPDFSAMPEMAAPALPQMPPVQGASEASGQAGADSGAASPGAFQIPM